MLPDFKPHPLLRNPHIQTIGVNVLLSMQGITYERVRLTTPDDDFFDLDVPSTNDGLSDDALTVLVVHGLEGSARRGYMCATYREMAQAGIRAIGMNLRSCSGELNRHPYSYHLGSTQDLPLALDWLRQRYPAAGLALMGFSLGGNITLKFTGEQGRALVGSLRAAIAISPPFDATRSARLNVFPNTIYRRYLLQGLTAKASANAAAINRAGVDASAGIRARTLRDYDNAIIAPLNGFTDADDYYRRASCGQFLSGIAIPTLIIRSKDDPFFYDDIPYASVAANAQITGIFTPYGGHCGFLEGWRQIVPWAQRTAAQWLGNELKVKSEKQKT